MNTRHKFGLRKPEKHRLGLRTAVLGQASDDSAQAAERILRDQFWRAPRPQAAASVHRFPASGAAQGTLAERQKNKD